VIEQEWVSRVFRESSYPRFKTQLGVGEWWQW